MINFRYAVELKILNTLWTKQINKFPDFIEYLDHLEGLDLKFNRLTIIPETIGLLKTLKYVDLSYNRINLLLHVANILIFALFSNIFFHKLMG